MSWEESVIKDHKFGRLTAKKLVSPNQLSRMNEWRCLCDCGVELLVYQHVLLSDKGCCRDCKVIVKRKVLNRWSNQKANLKAYKRNAAKRGILWSLSDGEALLIMSGDCRYCGSKTLESKCKLKTNGIDRLDNSLGYTSDNSVSCCSDCNYMKSDLTEEHFLLHISKIAAFSSLL